MGLSRCRASDASDYVTVPCMISTVTCASYALRGGYCFLSLCKFVCVSVCLSVRYHYIYSVPLHTEHGAFT